MCHTLSTSCSFFFILSFQFDFDLSLLNDSDTLDWNDTWFSLELKSKIGEQQKKERKNACTLALSFVSRNNKWECPIICWTIRSYSENAVKCQITWIRPFQIPSNSKIANKIQELELLIEWRLNSIFDFRSLSKTQLKSPSRWNVCRQCTVTTTTKRRKTIKNRKCCWKSKVSRCCREKCKFKRTIWQCDKKVNCAKQERDRMSGEFHSFQMIWVMKNSPKLNWIFVNVHVVCCSLAKTIVCFCCPSATLFRLDMWKWMRIFIRNRCASPIQMHISTVLIRNSCHLLFILKPTPFDSVSNDNNCCTDVVFFQLEN